MNRRMRTRMSGGVRGGRLAATLLLDYGTLMAIKGIAYADNLRIKREFHEQAIYSNFSYKKISEIRSFAQFALKINRVHQLEN